MELCPYYTRFHAGFSRLNENFVTDSGIIKEHKGSIDVQSKVGAGTTFHIYLPTQIG